MLPLRLAERWLWLCLLALPGVRTAHMSEAPSAPLLVTQVPAAALESLAHERTGPPPPGSRIVRLDPARQARPLTPGFFAAGRPDPSDDADRFLFVGQRTSGERFQVWEQSLAGGEARQITHGTRDCLEALYLSTLFTLDAAEPRARLCFSRAGEDGVPSLYTCWTDGSDEQRITFQPRGASSPLLLRDGRLLFASEGAAGTEFFTVNVDGTDVQAFAALGERAAQRSRACETRDGHVLYLETTNTTALVSVSVTRSLRSRTELVPRIAGRARSLCALEDGTLLVCCRPADGGSTYELCRLDSTPVPLAPTPEWHELDAVPLAARAPRPGRSSVVDASLNDGLLYCLDAGLSDREPGPAARKLEILAPGAVSGTERVLGSAPVENDGSFCVRVPARTPLRVRLFDEQGRPLEDMQSWIWVMPRESRGCIGCHEDPERTPPNRHVLALRKPPHEIAAAR